MVLSAQENKHACDLQSLNHTHIWVWLCVWLVALPIYENRASSPGLHPCIPLHSFTVKLKPVDLSIDCIDCVTGIGNLHMRNTGTPCYGYRPNG